MNEDEQRNKEREAELEPLRPVSWFEVTNWKERSPGFVFGKKTQLFIFNR